MASRKKKTTSLAAVAPPADQMFVRVPLPPELVVLVRDRVGRLGALYDLAKGVLEDANKLRMLAEDAINVAQLLEGDAKKIAGVVRKARGRRRR